MKVSLNWVRVMNESYGCSNSSELDNIDKLAEKIGAQLGQIEEIEDLGKKYQGLLVAKVAECTKHANADKLSFCLIDDGGANNKVARNHDGLIEVVCGAPNVKAGQLVVWIPPGASVPASYEKDPFVIEAREIRGVVSNGMLASPKELALGDSHEGILVLEEGSPGDDFAKNARLDDYIIDIENKMFTHRPDCFGILGIARELAGIFGKPFKSPDWYREDASLPSDGRKNVLKLDVKNELPQLVQRFCAVAIKDVKVGPSPLWMQTFLLRSGVRPINNIVDITNWFMLITAQPLHAYDYDKVKTGVLGVRLGKKGEELRLLGGKTIKIDRQAIVITDGKKPIGLGGVMGGADTEVDENTKSIILEAANFDMNTTRRTAMSYGLFTDAATRFTKNQSPRQNRAVIVKAVNDLQQLYGGRLASPLIDQRHFKEKEISIELDVDFINTRLGLELSAVQVKKLLENVEFKVVTQAKKLRINIPFWRTDLEIPEDIVEEVGRLYGYDKLPMALPVKDLAPAKLDQLLVFKNRLRNVLSSGGANEILTYSFVHGSLLQKANQPPMLAYELKNALSPDLQYYRLSLMPSLLEKVHPNIKLGYGQFSLFELGKAHNKKHPVDGSQQVPKEFNMLALVVAANSKSISSEPGAAFYWARAYLDYLGSKLGVKFKYKPLKSAPDFPVAKPYEHTRSASISVAETGVGVGMIGEFRPQTIAGFKLPSYCAGFEIGVEELLTGLPKDPDYQPLPRFPKVQQDITLKVPAKLAFARLESSLNTALEKQKPANALASLRPLDIYRKGSSHKHVSFRLEIASYDKTLRTEEVNSLLDELASQANRNFEAERL